jgi:hypothetical protein
MADAVFYKGPTEEAPMRRPLLLPVLFAALILVALASAGRAQAQNYPWCAQYSGNMSGAMNCGFVSFGQCMANVSGIGGFCIQNNTYRPPVAPRSAPARARRHHGH